MYHRSMEDFKKAAGLDDEKELRKAIDVRSMVCAGQFYADNTTVLPVLVVVKSDVHTCLHQVKPNERAYTMRPKAAPASALKGKKEAAAEAKSPARVVKAKTKRKKSMVEQLLESTGYVKGPAFRREQLQVELVVTVARRFAKMHSDMVSLCFAVWEHTHTHARHYTQETVCLVDPFAGTHSLGVVATTLDCNYLGFDKDAAAKVRTQRAAGRR